MSESPRSVVSPHTLPVIVGVGEIADRPASIGDAREPLALMAAALQQAAADACAGSQARADALVGAIDSLDVIREVSWPYADVITLLEERLGLGPCRHRRHGDVGGETPTQFIHDAALRIARGECEVAAVVGAEAQHAVNSAARAGLSLPWLPRDTGAAPKRSRDHQQPVARALGIDQPISVYPLYENATAAHWGLTPAQALRESGELWSRFSEVAARTPCAWLKQARSAQAIMTPAADNRLIAWPYTLRMVANPSVNQGAAVLLTSLARARAAGIAEDRLVYLHGGAAAQEPLDYLQRDRFDGTAAQYAVLTAALELAAGRPFRVAELYSCFPVVPKMARRVLGLPADAPMTTIGGLSFFGAPLNNYMTHATAGMVRALRERPGQLGLLYGQGGLATKHHALVLEASPRAAPALAADYSVQSGADGLRGPIPTLLANWSGNATLETYTILFDRDGRPTHAAVIGRSAAGARIVARVDATDHVAIGTLCDPDHTPVGRNGRVAQGESSLLNWSFTT